MNHREFIYELVKLKPGERRDFAMKYREAMEATRIKNKIKADDLESLSKLDVKMDNEKINKNGNNP